MAIRERLRVAVIGAGHIPHVEPTASVDLDQDALTATSQRFGVSKLLNSTADLLAIGRPDAVFVLVSVLQATKIAAQVISAGIPNFLEKPPGLYASQTRQLTALARNNQTLTMIGLNRRFYSTLLRLKALLEKVGAVNGLWNAVAPKAICAFSAQLRTFSSR